MTGHLWKRLACASAVRSLWGSDDGSVLVAGVLRSIVLFCVTSGRLLLEIDTASPVQAVWGCGGLRAQSLARREGGSASLKLVAGTMSNGVEIWRVTRTGKHEADQVEHRNTVKPEQDTSSTQQQTHLVGPSTISSGGSSGKLAVASPPAATSGTTYLSTSGGREPGDGAGFEAEALEAHELVVELQHRLQQLKSDASAVNEIKCVWMSVRGEMVVFGGEDERE